MKQSNFKRVLAFVLTLALVLFSMSLFAQNIDSLLKADSLKAASLHSIATGTKVFGIAIPAIAVTVFNYLVIAVGVILYLAQFLLKRIPTETSVKIGGWLGKFLDVLTFFQKDVIK